MNKKRILVLNLVALFFIQILFFSCETTKLIIDSKSKSELNTIGILDLSIKKQGVFSGSIQKIDSNFKAASPKFSTGILNLSDRKNRVFSGFYQKLDSNFNASSLKYSNNFLSKKTIHIFENLDFDLPDTLKIKEICFTNNLDAIVVTDIDFRQVINHANFYGLAIPLDRYVECILYSKIYDKNGTLLYYVIHDSKNDTYNTIPTTYDNVNLAVGISYKKIYLSKHKK
jgi:hypothetical protein